MFDAGRRLTFGIMPDQKTTPPQQPLSFSLPAMALSTKENQQRRYNIVLNFSIHYF
jgi:hypothetical protein